MTFSIPAIQYLLIIMNLIIVLIHDHSTNQDLPQILQISLSKSSSKGLLCNYVVELLFRYQAVIIGVSTLNHFLQLRLVNGLTQLLRHTTQILN